MKSPDPADLPGPDAAGLPVLLKTACRAGASAAEVIAAGDIVCEQRYADLCRPPHCENYGLSPGCPPHVDGPAGFKKRLARYRRAVFFRVDVPSEILFSSERRECFQLLHEIAAGIERTAVDLGYRNAQAYAGGSCKQIFCPDEAECRLLAQRGPCRHPLAARPSMSGFGIDVVRLVKAAGWPVGAVGPDAAADGRLANIYGLVLID